MPQSKISAALDMSRPTPRTPPSAKTSAKMRAIVRRGTGLERRMEAILRRTHIRYVRQPRLLGHPDFRVRGRKILLFCDSSFWHGRRPSELSGQAFKVNREFWVEKLRTNRARDARMTSRLRREGWSVQRFWDTDIGQKPNKVVAKLRRALRGKAKKTTTLPWA